MELELHGGDLSLRETRRRSRARAGPPRGPGAWARTTRESVKRNTRGSRGPAERRSGNACPGAIVFESTSRPSASADELDGAAFRRVVDEAHAQRLARTQPDREAALGPVQRLAPVLFLPVESHAPTVAERLVRRKRRQRGDRGRGRVDQDGSAPRPSGPRRNPAPDAVRATQAAKRKKASETSGANQCEPSTSATRNPRDAAPQPASSGFSFHADSAATDSRARRTANTADQEEPDRSGLREGLQIRASRVVADRKRAPLLREQGGKLPRVGAEAGAGDRMPAEEPHGAGPQERARRGLVREGKARVHEVGEPSGDPAAVALQQEGGDHRGRRPRRRDPGRAGGAWPTGAAERRRGRASRPSRARDRFEIPRARDPPRTPPRARPERRAGRPPRAATRPPRRRPDPTAGPARWDRWRRPRGGRSSSRTRWSRRAEGPAVPPPRRRPRGRSRRAAARSARSRRTAPERRRMKKNPTPEARAASESTLSRIAAESSRPSTLTARSRRPCRSAHSVRPRAIAAIVATTQTAESARSVLSRREGSGVFSKS